MPSKEHEEILQKAILALRNEGLRVIRLDSTCVPDAIAIDFENRKVSAVEADTNPTNIYLTKAKYERYPPQFDEEIIATKELRKPRQKSYQAYVLALELRRQGLSERKIKVEIEKRLGEKVSAGTVHYWVTGKIVK
jgi:hypothetical protein